MPFFSIIIPLYNKEIFIENTLKSVFLQTFNNFEVIIVNDGSTDKSEEIILKFEDKRIKYFYQKNQGASETRNLGIEKSTSNYIAFLDADDLWLPNHLETLKNLIESYPNAGIYASRYQLVFKNSTVSVPNFNGIDVGYKGVVSDYFFSSYNYSIATSSSIAVPKQIFNKIGMFKPYISSGQDTDMWLRIALEYPVIIGNEITASYLVFIDESLSKTNILKKEIKRFDEYLEYEKTNKSLKKYLDIYRMEYAIQYKIAGEKKISNKLYNAILPENKATKSKIIYHLPQPILVELLKLKQFLKKYGVVFSIYQ
jgi:glycosyltransferase involved in cell wall biosynthesis